MNSWTAKSGLLKNHAITLFYFDKFINFDDYQKRENLFPVTQVIFGQSMTIPLKGKIHENHC